MRITFTILDPRMHGRRITHHRHQRRRRHEAFVISVTVRRRAVHGVDDHRSSNLDQES